MRELLDTLKPEMLNYVFKATEPKENGANALIIAARSGYAKIVEVLVSKYTNVKIKQIFKLEKGADPHATGTVIFDGEIISK